jgi:pyridoxal phosphate enzyme (YggS family)
MLELAVIDSQTEVTLRLKQVWENIGKAAERSGRNPSAVRLVAASKTIEPALILQAIASGVTILGENRVQEAKEKWPQIENRMRACKCEFHMVGHLQTNKSRDAVHLFEVIQSLDSERLARSLDQHAQELGKVQRVLVEVNTSFELTKFGVEPEEAHNLIKIVQTFKNLKLEGLMTIGPLTGGAMAARQAFRRLSELRDQCGGLQSLPELSMGMSQDYEIAIEEGATMIRVGSAIFGDRI